MACLLISSTVDDDSTSTSSSSQRQRSPGRDGIELVEADYIEYRNDKCFRVSLPFAIWASRKRWGESDIVSQSLFRRPSLFLCIHSLPFRTSYIGCWTMRPTMATSVLCPGFHMALLSKFIHERRLRS